MSIVPDSDLSVDYDDNFEAPTSFSTQEEWDYMTAFPPTQWIAHGNAHWVWERGPPDPEGSDSMGVVGGFHLPGIGFDLAASPPTSNNLYMLPQSTLPASMVFRDGEWSDPLPSPRIRTVQLPSVTPETAPESHQDSYGGENTFLGGGNDHHQSAQQWTDILAQEAEMSTSLVTTKPNFIENETRSEPTSPASSSGGGYNRTQNDREKRARRAQICRVLGIPMTAEVPTLKSIIEHLGETAPVVERPAGRTRAQREAHKREDRTAYFSKLMSMVGPCTERANELKVLDNVLALLTGQGGSEPQGNEQFHVFRLGA